MITWEIIESIMGEAHLRRKSPEWNDDGRKAWRIGFDDGGERYAVAIPYPRKEDAERALEVLLKTVDFASCETSDEVISTFRAYGLKNARQLCTECLAW